TSGMEKGSVRVAQAANGQERGRLTSMAGTVIQVAVDLHGEHVAATTCPRPSEGEREVCVWDAATGEVLLQAPTARGPTRYRHGGVALNSQGSLVAFDDYEYRTSSDGSKTAFTWIRLRSVQGEEVSRDLPAMDMIPWWIALSPDGSSIAAGGDRHMMIWDLA